MRVSSATKPESVKISISGDTAWIIFAENIVEIKGSAERDTQYQYDEYRMSTRNRSNLQESVNKNPLAWLEKAKSEDAVKNSPVVDEQAEFENAVATATTIAGLKAALLGTNRGFKAKAAKK